MLTSENMSEFKMSPFRAGTLTASIANESYWETKRNANKATSLYLASDAAAFRNMDLQLASGRQITDQPRFAGG